MGAFKEIHKALYAEQYNRQEIIEAFKNYSTAIITDPVTASDPYTIRELQREGALLCQSARLKAKDNKDRSGVKAISKLHDDFLREAGDLPPLE